MLQQLAELAHAVAQRQHGAQSRRVGFANAEPEHYETNRSEQKCQQEGGGIAVAKPFLRDEVMARYPGEARRDQSARHVADALQSTAPVDWDELGHQHLERDALRPAEETEQQEGCQSDREQGSALERPGRDRERQHHDPHERSDGDGIWQDALPAFDLCSRQDGRNRPAQLQQCRAEAHCGRAAGEQVEIGGDDGRGVDQAESGHAEDAMRQIGGVIAPEVRLHEGVVAPPDISVRARHFVIARGGGRFVQ